MAVQPDYFIKTKPILSTTCSGNYADHSCCELRLLYEIGTILAEGVAIKSILSSVLEIIARELSILRGTITILNRNSSDIAIEEAWGYDQTEVKRGHYQFGEGITGRVIETGNPKIVPRIDEEPLFLDRTKARKKFDTHEISFLCVPIKVGSEVIGTIGVDIPHASHQQLQSMVKLFSIIASSISQAVRLRQVTQEELEDLKKENSRLQLELQDKYRPKNIVGNSKMMRSLYREMEQVSKTNATVLLLGESGVGKEKFAHAIHYNSARSDKPFIKFNCAAIPETLIESTLFGHEKGSFTGAENQHKGKFEMAEGGTIFLDEIGEMPLSAQAKFLRILQEREFERIGGNKTIRVNIRIIAATNRDLPTLIKEGRFREDLYYRLNVFPLVVPPLRERKTDIILLANHFVEKYAKEYGKNTERLTSAAIDLLVQYNWPGNVRELENTIERAVILAPDKTIHTYHLPPCLHSVEYSTSAKKETLTDMLDEYEVQIIKEELQQFDGSIAKTAERLGVTERILRLRVAKYHLKGFGGHDGST